MTEEEYGPGSSLRGSPLAPQLGTDTKDLAKGRVDMRRLSVLTPDDIQVLLYAKLKSRKSTTWKTLRDEYLNLKVSEGGRGRRDIIHMESVSRGGPANLEPEMIRPGLIARNIYKRGWKEEQELEQGR